MQLRETTILQKDGCKGRINQTKLSDSLAVKSLLQLSCEEHRVRK